MESNAENLKSPTGDQQEQPDVYDELKEAKVTFTDFSELPPPPKEGLLPKYQKQPEKPTLPVSTELKKHRSKHERHPVLALAAKLAIITGALAGCTGHGETIPITQAAPEPVTAVTPEAHTADHRFSSESLVSGEPISPEQTQLIIQLTGLGEIKNLKSISFVDKATTSRGTEVQILSIDGAKPFASTGQIIDTINKYEQIAEQGKEVTARLEIDSGNSIDVPYKLHHNVTHNKFIFFGNSNFRISQAMPETYGGYTSTYAITRDGSVLGLDGTATFITNSGELTAGNTNINYAEASLNIESCQNTIRVGIADQFKATISSVSAQNPQLTENRINHLGQELVCNSLGFAKTAKLGDLNYSQYKTENNKLPSTIYAPLSVKQIVVDEVTYSNI